MLNKTFSFKMSSVDGEFYNKVKSIKGLRALTGLGLKEAKELSENIADAYPNAYTTSLKLNPDVNSVKDGIDDIVEGGIAVIDNSEPVRVELLSNIQDIGAAAISNGQYDIAQALLDLLVANQ